MSEQTAGSSTACQGGFVSACSVLDFVCGSPCSVFLTSLAFFMSDGVLIKVENIRFCEEQ